jgi:pimeloyl-ACP methyl ester carboxylesterase
MKDWWQRTFPQGRQSLKIIDADGFPVQIAYGEIGTGKPLFLLHGIGSWSFNWRSSIQPLSKHFRVICYDAKGYGFSEKPLSRREHSGHQVIELGRIIRDLCDEPVVIVAESLGALTALALAEENPQLIERLIVVNVPIFAQHLPHWGMSLISKIPIEVIQTIDLSRLPYLIAPLVREIMAIERRRVLYDPSILTSEDIYWMTYPYIEFPGTLTKIAEELQIAAREIEKHQNKQNNWLSRIQSNLSKIQCSTLILWGEQDSWFPASDGIKLQQYISNSELKILANCCHDASFGSASDINQAVITFLEDIVTS